MNRRLPFALIISFLLVACQRTIPTPTIRLAPTWTPTVALSATPTLVPSATPTVRPVLIEPRTVDQLKQVAAWRTPFGESIKQVTWSPDGRMIAVLTMQSSGYLWETATGRELGRLNGAMDTMAFSPDSHWIATGAQNSAVTVWDVSTRREFKTFENNSSKVMTVNFSPDGKTLFAGSAYGPQKFWNVETGQAAGDLGYLVSGVVMSSAFSPDGKWLALGTGSSRGGGIELWDVAKLEKAGGLFDGRDDKYALAYSPDGKLLASGSLFGNVKLWDIVEKREIKNYAVKGSVCSVSFSPDGQLLAMAAGQEAKLLNVASGRELWTCRADMDINGVAFSPDGELLAIGAQDGVLKLWGVEP